MPCFITRKKEKKNRYKFKKPLDCRVSNCSVATLGKSKNKRFEKKKDFAYTIQDFASEGCMQCT